MKARGRSILGQGIAGHQLEPVGGGSSARSMNNRFRRACGEIEPLAFAIAQTGQTNPIQNGIFIAVEIECHRSRGAVEEVQPSLPAFA